ncbi:phosphate signaling complex protein PhoU [Endothiovibrio diazotrophicus]
MDEIKLNAHISQQFNEELEDIRNRVLAMGGLVEQQISEAVVALAEGDRELAEKVATADYKVNAMEVAIDEECTQVIARRQPAAVDLRMVMAMIKTITDLERMGDEAERIAAQALRLAEEGSGGRLQHQSLIHMGERVVKMVHGALDAMARMDPAAAVAVARTDSMVDMEYQSAVRQLITFMMEDPRTITASLHVLWAARSLERIGDHARNICEYVIYFVKGKDVRHTNLDQI